MKRRLYFIQFTSLLKYSSLETLLFPLLQNVVEMLNSNWYMQ